MADFLTAYSVTAQHEGGWVKDSADRGGETYAGIARKFHPHWHGWAIVDAVKSKKRGQFIDNPTLRMHVKSFYRTEFWNKMHGDLIKSQRVAGFIYDWFVNSGALGIKKAQQAIGVVADGKVGPKTLAAINKQSEAELMDQLITARIRFVTSIVIANPSQQKFLNGWLNRILSFLK